MPTFSHEKEGKRSIEVTELCSSRREMNRLTFTLTLSSQTSNGKLVTRCLRIRAKKNDFALKALLFAILSDRVWCVL